MALMSSAAPYRIRHFLTRISKTDLLLLHADMNKRSEYESRVAGPAAAPAPVADAPPVGSVH
jgi:hypothetical protein